MVSFSLVSYNSSSSNSNITGGTASANGNGINKVFIIPHGLGVIPTSVNVQDASADAIGARVITKDDTNITMTYEVEPPTGTGNLIWIWTAIKVV